MPNHRHPHPHAPRSASRVVAFLFLILAIAPVGCYLMPTATKPTLQNMPPQVAAAATPESGLAPLTVEFNGAAADSDGSIASYQWNFGDGASSNRLVTSHVYVAPGNYTASLVVTDDRGASASSSVTVHATSTANQPPTASVSATPMTGAAPLTVSFSGSGTDADGTIATYAWAFGDGAASSAQNPSHAYSAAGTYAARLTVTDNLGASGSATVTITATGTTNPGPVANAGPDQLNKDPGTAIALTGAGSSNPGGAISGYAWSQLAGPAVTLTGANTATPSFQSLARTTTSYRFRLTVTDNGSPARAASDTVVVATRVTYDNAVGAQLLSRGTQPGGQLLGCTASGCHTSGGGLSPLTTYAQVFSARTGVKSKISSSGSMLKFLLAGEAQVIISWIDAGAPQKN